LTDARIWIAYALIVLLVMAVGGALLFMTRHGRAERRLERLAERARKRRRKERRVRENVVGAS